MKKEIIAIILFLPAIVVNYIATTHFSWWGLLSGIILAICWIIPIAIYYFKNDDYVRPIKIIKPRKIKRLGNEE